MMTLNCMHSVIVSPKKHTTTPLSAHQQIMGQSERWVWRQEGHPASLKFAPVSPWLVRSTFHHASPKQFDTCKWKRSDEHTSELLSNLNIRCRLLPVTTSTR